MASIKDVCSTILGGLDADILDYVVSMIENRGDDNVELHESVVGFLLSTEFSKSEEAANVTLNEIFTKLGISIPKSSKDTPVIVMSPPTEVLPVPPVSNDTKSKKKVASKNSSNKKSAKSSIIDTNDLDVEQPSVPNEMIAHANETKVSQPLKKTTKLSKKASASEKVEYETQLLEEELEQARILATKMRTIQGAYNGAVEASGFTLPNPGGGIPLLENASFNFVRGRRYGLIGRNGKGKSTLLRAFAARRVGDIPANVTVHYVSQDVQLNSKTCNQTPIDYVVEADIERRLLTEEMQALDVQSEKENGLDETCQKRLADIIDQLDIIEADTAVRRATELLTNLGFSEELRNRPLQALSGGWRVRTMLAAAIFSKPDMLLLDEPTNHLSILAVLWLARELSTNETWNDRIVVVVSHDRYFIDQVCTDSLHISGAARRLTQSRGNYTTWMTRRKEQQLTFARQTATRETEIETLKEYAGHGFRYGGSASQINKMQMKAKQAEKLEKEAESQSEELAALQEDIELPLNLIAGGKVEGFLIQVHGVSFGYPNCPVLFNNVEFGITSDTRMVLLGENGNGKTTLLKVLLGELSPSSGEVKRSPQVRYALVNQHHADQINPEMTPLQFMQFKFPGDGSYNHAMKLRGHLASCGVTGGEPDLQNIPTSALSGGQRSRVALAAVSFAKPHVLFLDEPTNNLDLESVAALAAAVKEFAGAVIVVSHDQYFVNEVADEAWVVNGGKVRRVESFSIYRDKQLAKLNK